MPYVYNMCKGVYARVISVDCRGLHGILFYRIVSVT